MRKNMSRLYESVGEEVAAIINIEPTSILGVEEGDVITEDMLDSEDDEALADLISLADEVVVDTVNGENAYTVHASVSDEAGAASLYQWLITYTNCTTDEDIEDVAPGLIAFMNDDDDSDDTIEHRSIEDVEPVEPAEVEEPVEDDLEESVSSKFAKYRKLYEAALAEGDNTLNEKGDEDSDEGDEGADNSGDSTNDDSDKADDSTSEDSDKAEGDDKDADEGDETEDVPMTAVVLTVKKDDVDKCKDELVAAGISEDDIETIDGEEDDENAKIKVDANAVKELKDYLSGKGIDLEEKIGGEIVDDEEGSDDEKKDDEEGSDDTKEDDKKEDGAEDDGIGDINFDELFGGDDDQQ